ncbi:MAG TPA: hypothetical protein PLM41_21645, partial [Saprospiraceae bacterium]|nr:hypothetical protein [Saprospiraceae bacterium]
MLFSRQRLSILLMTLGFGLLLAFVYLFLKKVWDDEVDSLKQQTNLLLVNAVRSIERSAFDRLIVQTMDLRRDSLHVNLQMRDRIFRDSLTERRIGPTDSMKFEYKRIELNDTTQVFETATPGRRVIIEPDGTVGSLSMIVAIQGDSSPLMLDQPLREHPVQDVFPVLEKK